MTLSFSQGCSDRHGLPRSYASAGAGLYVKHKASVKTQTAAVLFMGSPPVRFWIFSIPDPNLDP